MNKDHQIRPKITENQINIGILILDLQGCVTEVVNQAAHAVFKDIAGDLIDRSISDLFAGQPALDDLLAAGDGGSLEIALEQRGKVHLIYLHLLPLPGEPPHTLLLIQDSEICAQAEVRAQQSQENMHRLLNTMHASYALHDIILDEQGQPCNYRFLDINPAFEASTSLPREEIIGKTVLETMPNTEPHWIKAYGEVALTGKAMRFEEYSQELDKYFEVSAYSPRKGQFAVLFIDTTERKTAEAVLRSSEQRYRGLFENVPISLWQEDFSEVKCYLDELRRQGVADFRSHFDAHPQDLAHCASLAKILRVNQATLALYKAKSKEELIGSLSSVLADESNEDFKEELLALAEGNTFFSTEMINRTLDGDLLTVLLEVSLAPGAEETWDRVLISIRDVTERRRAERTLRASEERFRKFFENASIGMVITDLEGYFVQVNRRIYEMLGYTKEELLSKTFKEITHPEDIDLDLEYLQQLQAGEIDYFQIEKRYCHKQGDSIWVLLNATMVRDDQGRPTNYIGQIEDITQRKQAESKLQELAITDSLTGLYNRRHFFELAEHEWQRAIRYGYSISVIMLDIDHFKKVNDTYGHLAGDIVLTEASNIFRDSLRKVDILGRYGGEEFVILLPDTDSPEALRVAERLRKQVASAHFTTQDDHQIQLTVSLGVACIRSPRPDALIDELINRADQAVYSAKQSGRDRIILWQAAVS